MKKAVLSIPFVVVLLAVAVRAEAQQPKKVARICHLGNTVSGREGGLPPFRQRLRELGYIDGQNITIEAKYWEGKVERLPELANELVRLNCDLIFTVGTEAARAAKNGTKEIPIVIANSGDAVRLGFVTNLARPGGNVTGLSSTGTELSGKRLELLKETVPKLSQVGFLWSPSSPSADDELKEIETVAQFLKVEIQSLEVRKPDDIEKVFQAATKKRAEALMLGSGGFFAFHQTRILELMAKTRLPTMYGNIRYVEAGGLMAYAFDRNEQYRSAAEIVDKILKGTKPADIPVERPKKFEFVINLKTAKQIGLAIPQKVLGRADKVIK